MTPIPFLPSLTAPFLSCMGKLPIFYVGCVVPSEPPSNVAFKSRGKNSLEVSWEAPDQSWNGEPKGYQVCHSDQQMSNKPTCIGLTAQSLSHTISNLQPSTKYFVTVSAATSVGAGPKSSKVSKITNGGKRPIIQF